jgi:electron transport complex protein RnfG
MTDATGTAGGTAATGAPPVAAAAPRVNTWRLLSTMAGGGAIAGLVIVLFYVWTLPRVDAYKAKVLRAAIGEVLHDPARADTLWLVGGALTLQRPGGDTAKITERIYLGYDAGGLPVGYALPASEAGFADFIDMLVGYDPVAGRVLGLKVLANKETPGIADKVFQVPFLERFRSRATPLRGIKPGAAADSTTVEMITGATISSRAVIRGVNKAVTRWQPLLETFAAGAGAGGAGRVGGGANDGGRN